MTKSVILGVVLGLVSLYVVHVIVGHTIPFEPNSRGMFALEVVALTMILVGIICEEIWSRAKGEPSKPMAQQMILVFSGVLASGCVFIAIMYIARRLGVSL